MEQRFLYFGKLIGIHDLKNVLNLVEEHYFLGTIDFGPISEKPKDDLNLPLVVVHENSPDHKPPP